MLKTLPLAAHEIARLTRYHLDAVRKFDGAYHVGLPTGRCITVLAVSTDFERALKDAREKRFAWGLQ